MTPGSIAVCLSLTFVKGRRSNQRIIGGTCLGDGSPPEVEAFFVKLHIIFALKYNKQKLLLLSTFLGDLDIVSCAHSSRHPKRHHF